MKLCCRFFCFALLNEKIMHSLELESWVFFFKRMFLGLQAWEIASQINAEKTFLKRKWGKQGYTGIFAATPGTHNERLLFVKEN